MAAKVIVTCFCSLKNVFNLPCSRSLEKLCLALFRWSNDEPTKWTYSYLVQKCSSNKVQLFWEGHKNLRNHPQGFDICFVNVKKMRKLAQTFVVFSEKVNFNKICKILNGCKTYPIAIQRIYFFSYLAKNPSTFFYLQTENFT